MQITEIGIFPPKKSKSQKNMNVQVSSQKIIPKTYTKYLSLILDEYLAWSAHRNIMKKKLHRKNVSSN